MLCLVAQSNPLSETVFFFYLLLSRNEVANGLRTPRREAIKTTLRFAIGQKNERYNVPQLTHPQAHRRQRRHSRNNEPAEPPSREYLTLQHLLGYVQGLLDGSAACQYLIVLVHVKIQSLPQ